MQTCWLPSAFLHKGISSLKSSSATFLHGQLLTIQALNQKDFLVSGRSCKFHQIIKKICPLQYYMPLNQDVSLVHAVSILRTHSSGGCYIGKANIAHFVPQFHTSITLTEIPS